MNVVLLFKCVCEGFIFIMKKNGLPLCFCGVGKNLYFESSLSYWIAIEIHRLVIRGLSWAVFQSLSRRVIPLLPEWFLELDLT